MRYLRTRARDFKVDFPHFAKPNGKGKGKGKSNPTANSKRAYGGTQRAWKVTEQHLQVATPCSNQQCIDITTAHTHSFDSCRNKFTRFGSFGKGKGSKGKGKDGKGRGKGSKGMIKGKGFRKGFKGGSPAPKGSRTGTVIQLPTQPHGSSSTASSSAADVTCYFYHQKGHYKSL